MDVLSTALQLILAAASCWACYRAIRSEDAAEKHSHDLRQSKGRLIANEQSIAELADRHVRLNGRVNAALHRLRHSPEEDDFEAPRPHAPSNGADLDPDLAAELALQNAPAAAPGK